MAHLHVSLYMYICILRVKTVFVAEEGILQYIIITFVDLATLQSNSVENSVYVIQCQYILTCHCTRQLKNSRMSTFKDKDEIFYEAFSQSITDIAPEYQGTIHNKRECVRVYKELMGNQRITKNDHIMKAVARKFNSISPLVSLTNMSAAQYYCKKFKRHDCIAVDAKIQYDQSIFQLIQYLTDE